MPILHAESLNITCCFQLGFLKWKKISTLRKLCQENRSQKFSSLETKIVATYADGCEADCGDETWVWLLIWEDPICHGATKPLCHKYWACALEFQGATTKAHAPYSPCSTREAPAVGSTPVTREQPPLATTQEKPEKQCRPSRQK